MSIWITAKKEGPSPSELPEKKLRWRRTTRITMLKKEC